MVDLGQFSGSMQLTQAINEAAKTAQANKVSCMAMNHRIQIASEIVKAAFERQQQQQQPQPGSKTIAFSESAFKSYVNLLDRMKDFVLEISKKKTFSKLFYALRYRDEFDALLREFDSCVMELNLGIALRTQAQLETDRNALEEDMVELKDFRKDLQNGLDSLGGQLVGIRQMIATNQPMDDILASVELDYNQVQPISSAETRKGRTFPVHKRSWLAQEVAEKPLGYFGSQDMLDMLKSEVAILKKLDRCNYITRFMGVTNRNNQISIIMEWLPNGDLASFLAKGKMDWEQKLFIAADIGRGLQFLHEVGIIHKTLRAKNILLTRFNQAKITNFRQSRLESAQTRPMSDPFSFVRWLAPEKMTPKEVRYGAECDIYSFGMLLFEIASNKIPFEDRSDRELPELIVLKDFYETVPTGTPLEFANIMSACWSHDPRLRPTVSQVLLILRDACVKFENGEQNFGGLPTSMRNPPPLFAINPPDALEDGAEVYPISPPMTPIGSSNGHLTPDVWNNPYVNKRYVEESLEELRRSQQQIGQQVPTPMPPQSQPQPQRQQQPPSSLPLPQRQQQQVPPPQIQSQPAPKIHQSQPQQQTQQQVQPLQPKVQPLQPKVQPLQPKVQHQQQQHVQQQQQHQHQHQQHHHQQQQQPQPTDSLITPPLATNAPPMSAPSMLTPPTQPQQQYSPKPRPATVPGLNIQSSRMQQQQHQQLQMQQQQQQQQQHHQPLHHFQQLAQQQSLSPPTRAHSAGSVSKQEYNENENHEDTTVILPRQQQALPQQQQQVQHQSFSHAGSSSWPASAMSPIAGTQTPSSPGFVSAQAQGPMAIPLSPSPLSPPVTSNQQGVFERPPLYNRDTRPVGIKPKRIGGGAGAEVQPLDVNMNRLSLHEGGVTMTPTASTPTTIGMTGGSHDRTGSSLFSSSTSGSMSNGFHGNGHQQHSSVHSNGSYSSNNGSMSSSSSSPSTPFSSSSSTHSGYPAVGGTGHNGVNAPRVASQHSSTNLMVGRPVSPNPTNNPNTMSRALRLHENHERDKAWVIFRYFYDQGNVEGMYWTAYYLFHGEGGQAQDRRRSLEIFLAVTQMDLLNQSPTTFDALTQHQQQQRLHFQRLASNAHFYTAVCYLEGQGIERSHLTGFGHMEMAADTGNAFAQFLVGEAYHKGSAVVQANIPRRNHYWQLAARQREQRAIDQCRKFGIPI